MKPWAPFSSSFCLWIRPIFLTLRSCFPHLHVFRGICKETFKLSLFHVHLLMQMVWEWCHNSNCSSVYPSSTCLTNRCTRITSCTLSSYYILLWGRGMIPTGRMTLCYYPLLPSHGNRIKCNCFYVFKTLHRSPEQASSVHAFLTVQV